MIRGVKSQIDLSFLTKEEMSMSIKSTFAREIYHARSERSLTQEQVADIVSISVRWYQQIEKGLVLPGSIVLLRLMVYFDLDVGIFKNEEDLFDRLPGC